MPKSPEGVSSDWDEYKRIEKLVLNLRDAFYRLSFVAQYPLGISTDVLDQLDSLLGPEATTELRVMLLRSRILSAGSEASEIFFLVATAVFLSISEVKFDSLRSVVAQVWAPLLFFLSYIVGEHTRKSTRGSIEAEVMPEVWHWVKACLILG